MKEPEFKNLWRKRATVRLECPSGSVCLVTRPGPALALRIARLQRTLKPLLEASKVDGTLSLEEAQARAVEQMDEATERATLAAARETVVATVVKPKLYLNPDPDDPEQIGVDDIDPIDFWFIFNWATMGGRDLPVSLEGGESTTVDAVELFPRGEESGVGGGDNSGHLPGPEPVAAVGA